MIKETMTVHKALSELKVLDKRIYEKISAVTVCATNKHSNSKVNGLSIDDCKKQMKEQYQSVLDLINRRNAIKTALSDSNAKTKLVVSGKEYTIAQAIEMKRSGIQQLKEVLSKLSGQYNNCQRQIVASQQQISDAAEKYVIGLYGNKEKANSDEAKATYNLYIEQNSLDFVDAVGVSDEVKRIDDEVSAFESDVDSAISVSNATTVIEVEY